MSFTPETLLRHWQTLRLIPRHPKKITASELHLALRAEGFAVDKRTIERDLKTTLSLAFPIYCDDQSKPFGWSWDKDSHAFSLAGLSNNEALALLMVREHLRLVMPSSTIEQLAPYFKQAETKLETLAGRSALTAWLRKVSIVPQSQPLLPPLLNDEILATLQEALLLDQQCSVTYKSREVGQDDEYSIHPLGLVQKGSILYLVCTIKAYINIRILAVHRVKEAKILNEKINRPTEFDLQSYLASGAFGWGPGGNIILQALFSPETGKHFEETAVSNDQLLTINHDGRIHVTATVTNNQQLRWWLLGFGDGVEVISPPELRQEISTRLQTAASRYVAP